MLVISVSVMLTLLIVGNGYTKGHAEITLQELRECEALRKIFTELYA